ncbi:ARM repeat protein interacting with ABF2 [Spatholobus suberectus]|nr:ARM repeat protein interacting with ABF2 [Spatholobus suberectus]
MEAHHSAARRRLKRDLTEHQTDPKVQHLDSQQPRSNFSAVILQQVSLLNSALSPSVSDRVAVKSAVLFLIKLAKSTVFCLWPLSSLSLCFTLLLNFSVSASLTLAEDLMYAIVSCGGAVPALVRYLESPEAVKDDSDGLTEPYHYEVEKGCAFILGLLAIKPEYQQLIIDAGALPCLVDLLRRHKINTMSRPLIGLLRRVADTINNLAYENTIIRTLVRMEGGIPPLVKLLEFNVTKVQRAAAIALGTLAFNNDDNKNQIVECNALPPLVLMLRSEDPTIHYAAVYVIENLVDSSPDIIKEVLQAGALQPVICLLSSCCSKSQKEAAVLLGQFAATDSDCEVHISQRGAIPPLVDNLKSADAELQEMSAFALGNLAQPTKERVAITLKRLEEKMQGRALKHLIYLMRFAEIGVQRRVAIALAYLCSPRDRKNIFIDNNGLELLMDILESPNVKQKGNASAALHKLAAKASSSVSLFDAAPPSPTPQMYLGEEYVNNAKLSDVTFLIEGRSFYAHRDCLLSSDVFRALLDGSYREREAKQVVIPNIKWDVFELMMRFIYTGTVDVNLDIAKHLLIAADQYLLDDLKHICECVIARDISVENVSIIYEMSEDLNATTLKHACILFMLDKFDKLRSKPWYCRMVRCIVPDIRMFFSTLLIKSHPADSGGS